MKIRQLPPYLDRPHLDSIAERELDLLLLYELHASPVFRRFLLDKCALPAELHFVGAWRGVCDLAGETDVLLLCDLDGAGRTAVMIEDKIDATFQDKQAGRYRERGEAGKAEGAWDRYLTCLCAPRLFLEPLRSREEWDVFLAVEDIVEWLEPRLRVDPRAAFLGAALNHASGKFEKGGFVPDMRATAFWRAYRETCAREYPDLTLRSVSDVQSRNEPWPGFVPPVPIPGVHIEHKPSKGYIDLTFDRESVEMLRSRLEGKLPWPCEFVKVGGSAALRVRVAPVRHLEPFEEQCRAVRAALDAVRRILGEWDRVRLAAPD